MTGFAQALAEYREAIELAASAAVSEEDAWMLQIHENGLKLIERTYAETRNAATCRDLITAEGALHEVDGLRGDAILNMRAAFERLARLVSI